MWRARGVTHWSRWEDHEFAGLPAFTDIYWDDGKSRPIETMLRVDWAYHNAMLDREARARRRERILLEPGDPFDGWLPASAPASGPIRERQLARARGDWATADRIRDELAHLELIDHPGGTEWLRRSA